MVRALVRMMEMVLPVGSVFCVSVVSLGISGVGALAFSGQDWSPQSCLPAPLTLRLAILALCLPSSFAWALLATPGRPSVRDAFVSSVVFLLYAYVAFPSMWSCLGQTSSLALALQIAFFALLGVLVMVALITLIARLTYRAALAKAKMRRQTVLDTDSTFASELTSYDGGE